MRPAVCVCVTAVWHCGLFLYSEPSDRSAGEQQTDCETELHTWTHNNPPSSSSSSCSSSSGSGVKGFGLCSCHRCPPPATLSPSNQLEMKLVNRPTSPHSTTAPSHPLRSSHHNISLSPLSAAGSLAHSVLCCAAESKLGVQSERRGQGGAAQGWPHTPCLFSVFYDACLI